MGTVNISEYSNTTFGMPGNGTDIPSTPEVASSNVTSSGTSAQSSAFNDVTKIIRVTTDTTVRVTFGADPTATATDIRIKADTVSFFGVVPGQKIAVIDE